MKIRNLLMATASGLLVLASQAHAGPSLCDTSNNLVVNCGFETGDFTGWSLSGHDVPGQQDNLYGVEGQDPVDGTNPNSGDDQAFFADLDSNRTTLSQLLTTTTGASYDISFDLAQDTTPDGYYPNLFWVVFGNWSIDYYDIPVEGYTRYDFTATADSGSTLFSLTAADGLGEFLLDDVVVTPTPLPATVPEPTTLALTASAAFGLGLTRRRRQRK